MSDSKTIKPVLTNKFFTEVTGTFQVDRRAVVRYPVTMLKISSEFVGPFNKNWLYISALAYANMLQNDVKLIPYQVDAVTVTNLEYDDNGNCVWEISENLYHYRAWNMATEMIVSMSGAQYGGRAKLIELKGKHFIHSTYRYSDFIFCEGVHLIPMVPGRVITTSMTPQGIEVEFEFSPFNIFSLRPGETDSEFDYVGAFANACVANATYASEAKQVAKT